jgi:voltage-gated potassium channel
MQPRSLRTRVHEWLEPGEQSSSWEHFIDLAILTLIFVSVAVVALQSMPEMDEYDPVFEALERWCVYFFTLEYFLRIWTCVEDPRFSHPLRGRLRYVSSGMGMIDLLALAPFYLAPFANSNTVVFRLLRIFRLIRVFKFTRYNASVSLLGRVFYSRREELLLTIGLVITLVVISSTLMYAVEHDAQPKVFSSIPASMWWGIVTMTTVGYGDVFPITTAGKVVAGMSVLLGVGLFALPAGILASGFSEEMRKIKAPGEAPPRRRICFSVRLDDAGHVAHWMKPDRLGALRETGCGSYSLFRRDGRVLIGFLETSLEDPEPALRSVFGEEAPIQFEEEILHQP